MGNAIGSLITLGKGQQEEEDSVLLSEEHSLILTCCWVSVKVGAGVAAPTAQPDPAAGFVPSLGAGRASTALTWGLLQPPLLQKDPPALL